MPRLMPDPWFRPENLNRPLITYLSGTPHRPLREGERALGAFILPPFQRPPVWSRDQQVKFIESAWIGLPLGSFCQNVPSMAPGGHLHPCSWLLLDGQQRWTAILEYVAGSFAVFGHRYPDLPLVERRDFGMRTMVEMETRFQTEDECREIYERLAYGGTPHATPRAAA